MLTVRLPRKLEARLNKLSKRTRRTKSYYATKAISEFLDEQEDYLTAISRLEENRPPISLEEAVRKLGLDR